jgi:hypothetical protein
MKATEQTIQQVERFINKIAQKFPAQEEPTLFTDIHVRASQESGDLLAYDDDDNEITRCVVEQWINNIEENFYDSVTLILRKQLKNMSNVVDNLGILKPYSFVLENDDKENVAELYFADDNTVIIGGDIMPGLDEELEKFLDDLIKR